MICYLLLKRKTEFITDHTGSCLKVF